jgi:hypothetical protein
MHGSSAAAAGREGWAGFGNRIRLTSRESRTREGPKRVMMPMEFEFWQADQLVYRGDQSAIFFRERALGKEHVV